jgi:hypothetical protein
MPRVYADEQRVVRQVNHERHLAKSLSTSLPRDGSLEAGEELGSNHSCSAT